MCPLLERGIFTTCELLGRGKHRGKGKMPDYSGNLPCIPQVNWLYKVKTRSHNSRDVISYKPNT